MSALRLKGATVVYDKLIMSPGQVIVHTLDEAIRASTSGLLVYSQATTDPWVNEQYAALMQKAIEDSQLFIPVIIADAVLPPFAEIRYSADFRNADAAAYDRLVDQIARALTRPLLAGAHRPRRSAPVCGHFVVVPRHEETRTINANL
ncbi:MAG: toll/interleukin-1 receptor domain-containing protein [Trebonia sp.]